MSDLIQRFTLNNDGGIASVAFIPVPSGGGGGDLLAANNLSDLVSAISARTNLGLGSAAITSASAYATSAQGAKADSALQPAGNGSALTGMTKAQVGLGNVDNTSDADKPISTATQAALDGKQIAGSYATAAQGAKADTALQSIATGSVTLAKMADISTGMVFYRKTAGTGAPEVQALATLKTDLVLVKADVGLGSVDNTSDAAKPVSTAQQTALNLKANLASPTFTGTVGGITAAMVGAPSGSGSSTGTNTGDNAVNTLYSGLATSKQDTLVSATNIKTINGSTLLGSGNLVVSAGDPSYSPGSFTVATETWKLLGNHVKLTSTQRASVLGTGRLRVSN